MISAGLGMQTRTALFSVDIRRQLRSTGFLITQQPRVLRKRAVVAASATAAGNAPHSSAHGPPDDEIQQRDNPPKTRWQLMQDMIKANGPGAFFAYITVSNVLSVSMLSSAWLLFTRSTGQTPLRAWPQFLACYAGMWAAQHMARPYKVAVGLAAAPLGTAAVAAAERLFRVGSKTALLLLLLLEAAALLSCLGLVILYANRMVA